MGEKGRAIVVLEGSAGVLRSKAGDVLAIGSTLTD